MLAAARHWAEQALGGSPTLARDQEADNGGTHDEGSGQASFFAALTVSAEPRELEYWLEGVAMPPARLASCPDQRTGNQTARRLT